MRNRGVEFRITVGQDSGWAERLVLKSGMCELEIPELGLQATAETLGGSLGSVKALLEAMNDQLVNGALDGGRSPEMIEFLSNFQSLLEGSLPATVVLRDISGRSFVQEQPEADGQNLTVTYFERSADEEARVAMVS